MTKPLQAPLQEACRGAALGFSLGPQVGGVTTSTHHESPHIANMLQAQADFVLKESMLSVFQDCVLEAAPD